MLDEIQFDIGYFLLPEILNETPPMQTRLVNKATTGEIFRKLARALDPEQIVAQYGYLAKLPAVILMTSNFSEASRMSERKRAHRVQEVSGEIATAAGYNTHHQAAPERR